jgi:signal transduction histidine kinase
MSVDQGGGGETTPSGVRVLVADDDALICRQLAGGLAAAGYHVVTANDGEQAIAQARQTPPDVAIVDLEMPMGGLAVIRTLKEIAGPAVHVMVMTGHDDEAHRKDAFDAGTDDFVVKPTGLSEIKRRLGAATRTQRAFVDVRLAKEAADRRMTYGAEAAALLAHDLNNGLAIALGNLQYLRDDVSTLDTDQSDALSTTIRSLRRMSGLVANFVDVARFEDAAVKPNAAVVRVMTMLESVLELAGTPERQITIKIDCTPELEARVDQALIERVLHNLVGNATRYCNVGGRITVTAQPLDEEHSVRITVANTGPQIPENIQGTLFGKYVRGGGGKRGMGLYFCRLVAEAHGGRIDYEGSTDGPSFVLRLPGRA